jgi:hypothetical protein
MLLRESGLGGSVLVNTALFVQSLRYEICIAHVIYIGFEA